MVATIHTVLQLIQGWTKDRQRLSDAIARVRARGGTALYDTLAEAIPMAQTGKNRKKAVVIISDGNDTSSSTDVFAIKQLIRQTEVLVYAIGIDGESSALYVMNSPQRPPGTGPRGPRSPIPFPFPMPGGRRPPPPQPPPQGPSGGGRWRTGDDRVNVAALRDMTDDSGGRTEIVRDARDLNPSTASIADELSKQYYPASRDAVSGTRMFQVTAWALCSLKEGPVNGSKPQNPRRTPSAAISPGCLPLSARVSIT